MRLLTGALVLLACLAVACGDDSTPPTATQTSQRAEREATVGQQQTQAQPQPEIQTDSLPADAVGEHKGLRSQRNLLGEPDAPVRITYYGDFT